MQKGLSRRMSFLWLKDEAPPLTTYAANVRNGHDQRDRRANRCDEAADRDGASILNRSKNSGSKASVFAKSAESCDWGEGTVRRLYRPTSIAQRRQNPKAGVCSNEGNSL